MKTKTHMFVIIALLASTAVAAPTPAKPNILLFLVDDMGLMDTSVPFLADDNGDSQDSAAKTTQGTKCDSSS